jgi:GTP-binding protein
MFVDSAKVVIRSGDGGRGCMSFRREKFKPRGGPDGGDGGAGGDVTFIGDAGMNSLVKFRHSPRLFAGNGKHGSGNNKTGKKGQHLIVKVPLGTIARNTDTDEIICEITQPGIPVTIASGGLGGKGNQHFATPTNQAPRYFQSGLPGVEFNAILELKVMADVGLVGLPNAGKSSLITAVSRATPKIAAYPFTTLDPAVGVIELKDYRTIVLADIPGIIEGASHGRGLGTKFLKHLERTKFLLFVIDISSFAEVPPDKAFNILLSEIHSFGHDLEEKKFLIAANKIDIDHDRVSLDNFTSQLNGDLAEKVFPISALTMEGLDRLISALDESLNE